MIKFFKFFFKLIGLNKLIYQINLNLNFKYSLYRRKNLIKFDNKINVSNQTSKLSKNFVESLFNYFEENKKENDTLVNESMWGEISDNFYYNILMLINKDKNNFTKILNNPSEYNLHWGFDENCKDLKKNYKSIQKKMFNFSIVDRLISLCEYINILKAYHPATSSLFSTNNIDINKLIIEIEKKLEINLNFKNVFPGEIGVQTNNGILVYKEIQAIYNALKIKELIQYKNLKEVKILEIGGGLGRTAYYCNKFGINNYTMVDILLPGISQANYLARSIDENSVKLVNNIEKNHDLNKIKISMPEKLFSKNIFFDIVFNSDSLVEIDHEFQKKYVKYITQNTNYFISINHECLKFSVYDLFSKTKYKKYQKSLFPLEKGYVEEIFEF
tara:strand:+ start:527 stop:1687 length:1161 start_codon:yes stop_codon:yes gene_type:complete